MRRLTAFWAALVFPQKFVLGAHKCNHTSLVWDSSHSAVGIPSACSDLSLVDENVGDEGIIALAAKISASGSELLTLDLYENSIGNKGAVALADALASANAQVGFHLECLNKYKVGDFSSALGAWTGERWVLG
mmetsp:Transcript_60984/g.137915  ORF Transcript_60984/g.137915 Transcript_60984/m.137915 type:complete len:133 (-) Transcript_60984:1633-2031(-)